MYSTSASRSTRSTSPLSPPTHRRFIVGYRGSRPRSSTPQERRVHAQNVLNGIASHHQGRQAEQSGRGLLRIASSGSPESHFTRGQFGRGRNPRTSTASTMTTVNSRSSYTPFGNMQQVNRRSMVIRPSQNGAPPARRLRRNSLSSNDSDSSSNAMDTSLESNRPNIQSPSDTSGAAWRNWWCNSCRRPREECECFCVIS